MLSHKSVQKKYAVHLPAKAHFIWQFSFTLSNFKKTGILIKKLTEVETTLTIKFKLITNIILSLVANLGMRKKLFQQIAAIQMTE